MATVPRQAQERERPRRADDRAYQAIWSAIQEGQYRPGDRLFEEALAKELELSRTPVRAALARLGLEGIVEFDASGGARVVYWSERDLSDAFALRGLLEGWAAAEATRNMTPDLANHLSSLVETQAGMAKIAQEHSVQLLLQLGLEFHQAIAEASGNPWLVRLRQLLIQLPMVDRIYRAYTLDAQGHCMRDHGRILKAMLDGDPSRASDEMTRHLNRGFDLVKRALIDLDTSHDQS